MAEPTEDDIAIDTTWGLHMRALRREMRATFEVTMRTAELLNRVNTRLDQVQSDLLLMENKDMSRHGEILSILERLDRADIKPNPLDYGSSSTGILGARLGDPFSPDPKKTR